MGELTRRGISSYSKQGFIPRYQEKEYQQPALPDRRTHLTLFTIGDTRPTPWDRLGMVETDASDQCRMQ